MKHIIGANSIQWRIPSLVILTASSSSADTELTAFDSALLKAGIGNLNLIKVSSVVPPGAKVFQMKDCSLELPRGALIPTVYTRIYSATKGIMISSAIGVGIPQDEALNGMIFEASIQGPKVWAERLVAEMIAEAFKIRKIGLEKEIIISSETGVTKNNACTLAAAVLL